MMDWIVALYVNTLNVIHYMHDKYSYESLEMALHDTHVVRIGDWCRWFLSDDRFTFSYQIRELNLSATKMALRLTSKSKATSLNTVTMMIALTKSVSTC